MLNIVLEAKAEGLQVMLPSQGFQQLDKAGHPVVVIEIDFEMLGLAQRSFRNEHQHIWECVLKIHAVELRHRDAKRCVVDDSTCLCSDLSAQQQYGWAQPRRVRRKLRMVTPQGHSLVQACRDIGET